MSPEAQTRSQWKLTRQAKVEGRRSPWDQSMSDRLYLSLNVFLSVITFDPNSHHQREKTIAAIFQMKISHE